MGCFSYLCKKSNNTVLSSSFSGDAVHLFLLKEGKVIEHMFGNYDSYGRVFSDKKNEENQNLDFESFKWGIGWDAVCDLMLDNNKQNGIAAILVPYWKEGDSYPTIRSERMESLGYCGKDIGETVESPFHRIFN